MSAERVLLTLATLAAVGVLYLLMLKGWRGRQRRQGDLPAPAPMPAQRGGVLVGATPGLFVGTVFAGDWLDRVAVHGLSDRAAAWLTVHSDGVRIDREGTGDLWLSSDVLRDAELGDALAGKVVGREGMLVLTWQLGGRELHTRVVATFLRGTPTVLDGRPAQAPAARPA